MKRSDFAKLYSTLSHEALLEILSNPGHYQNEALAAASSELESRRLSEYEINAIKSEIFEKEASLQAEKESSLEFGNRIQTYGRSLAETLSPIQIAEQTISRQIIVLSIGLFLIFLYDFIHSYRDFGYMLTNLERTDLYSLSFLALTISIPSSIFLFFRRKKIGWLFLFFFSNLNVVSTAIKILGSFDDKPTNFSRFFPKPSIVEMVLGLLLFLSISYTISKSSMRSVYNISKDLMLFTILLSVAFAVIMSL